VRQLRREQKLRPDCDPVFRDKFSLDLVLALFSRALAEPQPDWPAQTLQTGFVWFGHPDKDAQADPRQRDFLDSGDPPIVFTQGSTAVHSPGSFYQVSVEAAARLGRRAVLLGAREDLGLDSNRVLVLRYAPYSQIFPYAAVNVHQGGSGTIGEALRAGRPQLIVPYGWDQPDNAARVERLGAGIHLPRREYSVDAATAALERLLREPSFSERAMRVGGQIRGEDGLTSACDAIESLLRRSI
jgi:UDP:flavonoid glycosyltransferase YjiC (YdhE family)